MLPVLLGRRLSLPAGVKHAWPVNESGAAARVASIGGLDLTALNSPAAAAGAFAGSNAVDFVTGSSTGLSRADHDDLSIANRDWTFACHLYPTNLDAARTFASKTTDGGVSNDELQAVLNANGTLTIFMRKPDDTDWFSVTSVSALSLNSWSAVRFWHDSVANLVGVQVGSTATVTAAADAAGVLESTSSFRLGNINDIDQFVSARMDAPAIWHRLLSDAEWVEYREGTEAV